MNLPLGYFPLMEIKYMQLLEEEQKVAASAKERLMSIDTKGGKVSVSDDLKYEHAIAARQYFINAILFQDEEALNKLRDLNLVARETKFQSLIKWFISLEDIHAQYDIIRQNNIKTDRLLAYRFIKAYLVSKFAKEISMIFIAIKRDDVFMSQLTEDLIKLKKRRKYSGSDPKRNKNVYELFLNFSVNELARFSFEDFDINLKFNIDTFINVSKGKTEAIYLRLLMEECFDYNLKEINDTRFLGIIFGLLKLLMPDRKLMDEESFYEASQLTYKSYDAYKAQVLKKILYPKHKPKRSSSVSGSL